MAHYFEPEVVARLKPSPLANLYNTPEFKAEWAELTTSHETEQTPLRPYAYGQGRCSDKN